MLRDALSELAGRSKTAQRSPPLVLAQVRGATEGAGAAGAGAARSPAWESAGAERFMMECRKSDSLSG